MAHHVPHLIEYSSDLRCQLRVLYQRRNWYDLRHFDVSCLVLADENEI